MRCESLYDADFYAWSREQAAVLRRLPTFLSMPNDLDLAHVAEEIEDLGKSELRGVRSHLRLALVHIIKAASCPLDRTAAGWREEIINHLALARDGVTPAMRKDIDLEEIWRAAGNDARRALACYGQQALPLPAASPFGQGDLLEEDSEAATLIERLLPAAAQPAARISETNRGT